MKLLISWACTVRGTLVLGFTRVPGCLSAPAALGDAGLAAAGLAPHCHSDFCVSSRLSSGFSSSQADLVCALGLFVQTLPISPQLNIYVYIKKVFFIARVNSPVLSESMLKTELPDFKN